MVKTRGSVRKASKSVEEHASSATAFCKSESPRLVQKKELQTGIVPCDGEEVLENKGPINEAFIERMTCGKDMPMLKERKLLLKKKKKKLLKMKKKKEEEDSIVNIFTAPEFVGANIDNLEREGVRPAEIAEVTSKEQCNSLAIVVYTGQL
ncbi:hypothetical protein PVK06_043596 [Gossypium arboreum]|uniref:Uncharacterized protein n=1 Tax=Gossypium arboreum TaxID=29729 RepID=A0ABR0MP81_GOSAR|nr:hypothetical protein PVK06_043596 [Gossypium arboreum]